MTCVTSRWKYLKSQLNNLPPEEFWNKYEETPEAQMLDVRTDKEREEGIFPQAIHVNFFGDSFWDQLESLDKEGIYFVYCNTGRRSLRVSTYMKNSGFKHIFNLDDGVGEFLREKMTPVSQGRSRL